MKSLLKTVLSASLITTALSASPLYLDPNFENDFDKIDRYFNAVMHSHFGNNSYDTATYPKLNIFNEKDAYILKFNVAGIPKENIKLSINNENVLTLEGEQKVEKKDEEKSLVRQEMFYGKFKRILQLPKNINQDKLSTKYENGILTLTIPKKEEDKPASKMIEIK